MGNANGKQKTLGSVSVKQGVSVREFPISGLDGRGPPPGAPQEKLAHFLRGIKPAATRRQASHATYRLIARNIYSYSRLYTAPVFFSKKHAAPPTLFGEFDRFTVKRRLFF